MTACWRSLVWFIAAVTSGATTLDADVGGQVSGVPCT